MQISYSLGSGHRCKLREWQPYSVHDMIRIDLGVPNPQKPPLSNPRGVLPLQLGTRDVAGGDAWGEDELGTR